MKLEVGDRIYATNYGDIISIYVVQSVTEKLAICEGGAKFKREYDDLSIKRAVVQDKWATVYYEKETPELKQQLVRQNALRKVHKIDFSTLQTDQIIEILKIINTTKEE